MASHLLEKVAQDGTNSLRERVYRHLEAALREGQLHHGTCLDQDRLCEELGVSRTPLRDALLRLEAEGFVTIQPRKVGALKVMVSGWSASGVLGE